MVFSELREGEKFIDSFGNVMIKVSPRKNECNILIGNAIIVSPDGDTDGYAFNMRDDDTVTPYNEREW